MAFIVSYTFTCYSRSTSIIDEHTTDYTFSLLVIPCSGVDHLIKLLTQTCTAFLYFLHLLSPSSSGSGVIHIRSSRYLLLLHLEIVTPPLHATFVCRIPLRSKSGSSGPYLWQLLGCSESLRDKTLVKMVWVTVQSHEQLSASNLKAWGVLLFDRALAAHVKTCGVLLFSRAVNSWDQLWVRRHLWT